MADIQVLAVKRRAGRRRVQPVPGVPLATVLNFDPRDDAGETPEQRLARIDEALNRLAYAILMASRVTREICAIARLREPLA